MAENATRRGNGGLYGIVGGLILAVGVAYFVGHSGTSPDSDGTVGAGRTTSVSTEVTKP